MQSFKIPISLVLLESKDNVIEDIISLSEIEIGLPVYSVSKKDTDDGIELEIIFNDEKIDE